MGAFGIGAAGAGATGIERARAPAAGAKSTSAPAVDATGIGRTGNAAAGGVMGRAGDTGATLPGALELTACKLEDPSKVAIVLAECGELSVAENPAEPSGRHITL